MLNDIEKPTGLSRERVIPVFGGNCEDLGIGHMAAPVADTWSSGIGREANAGGNSYEVLSPSDAMTGRTQRDDFRGLL
ncbi:hypothetical protein [Agrobacterium genomosp. 2]|uniref:hypothetical protein n=1 Tax=Agrobacterium genomosp. 2 TaxID=1183409 RepID=UPI001119AD6F|nr:hypothetical protein [Agrobacterium genomosp. 2]